MLSLSIIYLPGDRLSTVPTTLRPNGAYPTANRRRRRHHRHTHWCVCVWLVAAAKQQQAAGESPTRSFGVCTANQTLALTPYLCAATARASSGAASEQHSPIISIHPPISRTLARSLSLSLYLIVRLLDRDREIER